MSISWKKEAIAIIWVGKIYINRIITCTWTRFENKFVQRVVGLQQNWNVIEMTRYPDFQVGKLNKNNRSHESIDAQVAEGFNSTLQ